MDYKLSVFSAFVMRFVFSTFEEILLSDNEGKRNNLRNFIDYIVSSENIL